MCHVYSPAALTHGLLAQVGGFQLAREPVAQDLLQVGAPIGVGSPILPKAGQERCDRSHPRVCEGTNGFAKRRRVEWPLRSVPASSFGACCCGSEMSPNTWARSRGGSACGSGKGSGHVNRGG